MVTEISGAGNSHSVVAQSGAALSTRTAESLRSPKAGVAVQETAGEVSRDKQTTSAAQVAGAYAQFRNRQEILSSAASVVREVSSTADKAGQLLDKMESDLGAVVKMYPPYPVDSPERVQLLNNFGGLRKQIEALTFPPEDALKAVGRLLGSQVSGNADSASETEKVASLVKEPMWDIPTPDPLAASDAEVAKSLDQVKAMKSVLEDLQAGMWKDVISFVKQVEPSAAENGSAEVRNQLADLSADRNAKGVNGEAQVGLEQTGIGRNANQLVQAVESR